jgi:hypothetical protein
MISVDHRGIASSLRAAAPLILLGVAAVVLLQFPPERNSFYPQCPIYATLHLLCPGCGGTRALAALLHGRLHEALRYNALVTLMLPLAAGYGSHCYWRFVQRRPLRLPQVRPAAVYACLAIAAIFTVERNLPMHWR